MISRFLLLAVISIVVVGSASAQAPASKKPPIGVPADAILFDGNWYKVYLEQTSWKNAKSKCEVLGGHLAIVPDAPTNTFVNGLAGDMLLWLGASEKVKGYWVWVDGTPMNFKVWGPGQPDNLPGLQMLHTWRGAWGDLDNESRYVVGYICEWKAR